ncbi:unnamed protein product, partial [marine sediment metagenome]
MSVNGVLCRMISILCTKTVLSNEAIFDIFEKDTAG